MLRIATAVAAAVVAVVTVPVLTTELAADTARTPNPFSGRQLYVDPDSLAAENLERAPALLGRIAAQPQAFWFDATATGADVARVVGRAVAAREMPVLVAYAIPNRDCAGRTAGAAPDAARYAAWIADFARGIGPAEAAVILEPDALAQLATTCPAGAATRERILAGAVRTLQQDAPHAAVYLDAGHSGWVPAARMAALLSAAGVARARGFSLNVSNFEPTAGELAYGTALSRLTGGSHFVVDTGRNGAGPAPTWCNPAGQALGPPPTTATGAAAADALLWIKRPGESDGTCGEGDPPAGRWFESYAEGLAARAGS